MLRNLLTTAILLACLILTALTNPQPAAAQEGTPATLRADEPAQQMITGAEPGDSIGRYIGAGDIDGDGETDLVMAGLTGSETPGRVQLYYGNGGGFDDLPGWTLDGENPADNLGGAKLAVGDLNGDGYDDIALGAPGVDGDTGRALLFYGGPDGPATVPDWRYDGVAAKSFMGSSLAMGDVNADGYPDLLVGAGGAQRDLSIWFGGAGGVANEPDQVVEGAGTTLDTGDFNGDGVDDVFAAALGDDLAGAVNIFLGLDGRGLAARPTWIIEGEGEYNLLGLSLANAGDLNGDGLADLIAGAPLYPYSANRGRVYVLYGTDLTPRGTARLDASLLEWIVTGSEDDDMLGWAVSPAGDIDGDGYDDALVSAAGAAESAGEVQIFRGGPDGLANTPGWVLSGEEEGDFFGSFAADLGDLNGDGNADFAVSANEYPGGEKLGRLYLYWGGPHLTQDQSTAQIARSAGRPALPPQPSSAPAWAPANQMRISVAEGKEAFGWPAQIVGDVNGDGYDDLAVSSLGNPEEQMFGRLLLYYGGKDGPSDNPDWEVSTETWGGEEELFAGIILAAPADVNGDGFDDLAVTAIDFGSESTKVLLYYGGIDGLAMDPQEILPPVTEELIFGIHLWAAGDVNGDGYADLAVAGLDDRTDGMPVYVYHGGVDGVGEEPAWSVVDLAPLLGIGVSLAAAGDVTGDGFDDVLVGSPGHPEGEERGQVRLYAGGPDGLAEEPTWTQDGRRPEGFFGLNIANLGDVDGDGQSDYAVSEPNEGGEDGRTVIYLGSAAGPQGWREQPLRLELKDGIFGVLVFGAGDLNGDGYNDLVVGSISDTGGDTLFWHFFLGSSDGLLPKPVFETTTPGADEEFLLLQKIGSGDLNGDGYTDFVLSTFNPAMLEGSDSFEAGEVIVYYGGSPQDEGDEPSSQSQIAQAHMLPPSAQVAVADLEVLAQYRLEEPYRYLSLSPDGRYLLVERSGELLCILSTDTLSEESCVAWKSTLSSINYGSLTWSPDSRYVALTEDSIRFFHESDIWVLDVAEARLRNLTEDGVQGGILQAEGAMVDAAPAWSPDGSRVLFARSQRLNGGEWDGTALYILDVGDGSSTKLMTITDDVVLAVPYTPHWLSDGSTILYSILFPTEQEENGIWSVREDGGGVRQILASTKEEPMPVLTDVSIATAMGLVWYPPLALQQSATGSPFGLVQLETGEVEGLTATEYEGNSFAGPYAATFSPDGSKLLYTYRDAEGSYYLAVRDVQSGEEAVLVRNDDLMGIVAGGIPALDWASNDLLFAGTLGNGLLLKVGGPAQESDAAGQLEIDIGYRGNFYVETFGYAPDAPNIAHYALIIPEEERERFEGVPVFTSIHMPADASDVIELREERQEYAWILDYLHQAPEGKFRGNLAPGTYLVKVAFLAGPVSREEAGVADDAILWAGVTGGGASTREYTEVEIEPGQVHSLHFSLSDANGWACPWLYVHDGSQYVRATEILRNVQGPSSQTTERTKLGAVPVINGAIRLQIAEEKAETSYIDHFALMVDGMRLLPDGQAPDVASLAEPDQEYLVLRQGDTVELIFRLPPALNDREEVDVTVIASGYYVPGR